MFEDHVRITRVYGIYGVKLMLMNMLKDLYMRYRVIGTFILLLICIGFYVIIILEFEMPIFNITGLFEAVFHIIVTMTTVGYGDKSAQSSIGQTSMVAAVYFGVVFEGLFLIAWSKFTTMEWNEQQAYLLIQRINYKEIMKNCSASIFSTERRL